MYLNHSKIDMFIKDTSTAADLAFRVYQSTFHA